MSETNATAPGTSLVWNDTTIERRTSDGYVNATDMCRANGKQWKHFQQAVSTTTYIEALSRKSEIPTNELVLSKQGEGTWVHPDIATELARWISADFAVAVNQWFRHTVEAEIQKRKQPEPTPAPVLFASVDVTLARLKDIKSFLEDLNRLDDRAKTNLADYAMNALARSEGQGLLPPSPEDEELAIPEAWLEVTGSRLSASQAPFIGKQVAKQYRKDFETEPLKHTQYINGRACSVNTYRRGWLLQAVHKIWKQLKAG